MSVTESGTSLIGWLEAQCVSQVPLAQLLGIGVLAPLPGFIDAFPSAEVGTRFIILVVLCQLAGHERRVEVFAENAVLFFIKRQAAFEQFHLKDKFVNFHVNPQIAESSQE